MTNRAESSRAPQFLSQVLIPNVNIYNSFRDLYYSSNNINNSLHKNETKSVSIIIIIIFAFFIYVNEWYHV